MDVSSTKADDTCEAIQVIPFDPPIASRFQQMELPIWDASEGIRRVLAGHIQTLPAKVSPDAIDQRFIGYALELTDVVAGRAVGPLRRRAVHAVSTNARRIGLEVLQLIGARMPTIINQRA
jgi:hypothetical protein